MNPASTRCRPTLPQSSERGIQTWLIAIVCVAYMCSITVADPDLWGHTLYGLRALDRGVLAERTDPFSYTAADKPWINHEWLTELGFGWLWQACGGTGLWCWRGAMALGLFVVAVWCVWRSQATIGATLLLWIFSAQSLAGFFMFVRPQLATLVLFAGSLAVLRHSWESPRSPWIWLLPPATALWANLHGGFLAGLGVQAVFLFAWAVARRRPERTDGIARLATVFALSWAASLVNPYGWHLHSMLWEHLVPEQAVREWRPLWSGPQSPAYYTPFLLPLIALSCSRRWQWIDLLVLFVVGVQSLLHIRHVALLAVTNLVLLPGPLSDGLQRRFPAFCHYLAPSQRLAWRWGAVVLSLALMIGLHLPALHLLSLHGIRPWEIAVETSREAPGVPRRAVTWIQERQLSGNLVTDYAWGQYALWHLHPAVRVAFDGRYRTVYSDQLEREYLAFARGDSAEDGGTAILNRYPTEMVLLPRRSPGRNVLEKQAGWVMVFSDLQACVYVRRLAKFQHLFRGMSSESASSVAQAPWIPFPGGPVLNPLHAETSAKGRMRHDPHVCAGYHDSSQSAVSSGKAGVSGKSSGGKPMRLDDMETGAGLNHSGGKT